MTQPGSLLPFKLSQLTHHTIDVRLPPHDCPPIRPQQEIRKLQRFLDEPNCPIDLKDTGRGLPRPLLMTPIVRIHQRWAVPLMETRTVNRAALLLEQPVSNLMEGSRCLPQRRLSDHHGAVRLEQRSKIRHQLYSQGDWIECFGKQLIQRVCQDDEIEWASFLRVAVPGFFHRALEIPLTHCETLTCDSCITTVAVPNVVGLL